MSIRETSRDYRIRTQAVLYVSPHPKSYRTRVLQAREVFSSLPARCKIPGAQRLRRSDQRRNREAQLGTWFSDCSRWITRDSRGRPGRFSRPFPMRFSHRSPIPRKMYYRLSNKTLPVTKDERSRASAGRNLRIGTSAADAGARFTVRIISLIKTHIRNARPKVATFPFSFASL
jgi:hypothetical protein